MKKILFCIALITMASCSSDDSASSGNELISVTENYYRGNQQLYYSKKMNFRDHKIISIEEQNGDHTDFEYNDKT